MSVTRSDRESTSLICAVAADGSKLRPCVLRSRRGEAALSGDSRWESINCSGWTDEALDMEYVWRIILPYTAGRSATIVHDSLSTHNTPDVASFLLCHNLLPITVPAGHTAILQPLDVGIFAPVEARAKRRWNEEKQRNRERADTQWLSMSLHVDAFMQLSRFTVRRSWDDALSVSAAH